MHFSPLSTTVYEWVEWMWRMSKQRRVDVERSGYGQYFYLRLQKKVSFVPLMIM